MLPNLPPWNRATGKNIPIAISSAGMFKNDDLT
jgi:hypothetical protein